MNLDLNFVCNSDLAYGNWEWAIKGFKNVLRLKHDHAFAHFYIARAYEGQGNSELAVQHREQYFELAKTDFWGRWCYIFDMEGINRSQWSERDYGLLEDVLLHPADTNTAREMPVIMLTSVDMPGATVHSH